MTLSGLELRDTRDYATLFTGTDPWATDGAVDVWIKGMIDRGKGLGRRIRVGGEGAMEQFYTK